MKKKISLILAALLLSCCFAFAQNGGMQVELKPFNPQNKPPYGDIVPPIDTFVNTTPNSIIITTEVQTFVCFQNSTHLTLQCNDDVQVEIVIYEMLSGVKHTSTINMVAGEIYTIATPWGVGLYTIRLTLSDGTILEGDFRIR